MIYNSLKLILYIIFKLIYSLEVKGADNLPASGGVLVASNHISLLDPPVIGITISRRIHFMAKEELFRNPLFGWLIRKLHAFPVRRGAADRFALKTAMDLLNNGHVVGVFPEGTRSKTGSLGTAQPGVAMMALKTGSPIVPVAIYHCDRFLFPKIIVKYGKPISIVPGKFDKDKLDAIGREVMTKIKQLLDE